MARYATASESARTMPPDKLHDAAPDAGLAGSGWFNPVLLWAFLIVGALIAYQSWVTLAAPSWGEEVTNWFRVAIVWPGVVVLLLISRWLTRTHQPVALPWWLLTVSMLGYALGKTLQVVFNQFVFAGALPFPWWSDGIALLAFPGFFLAPVLWPGVLGYGRAGLARAKVLFDTLLVMAAVTALSWYFFLAPLFQSSSASWQAKAVELAYPVADLGGCFALAVVLMRPHRDVRHRVVLRLLLLTAGCLIVADSWSLWLRLYAPSRSDALPNLLYVVASLLLPVAGLVQYQLLHQLRAVGGRMTQRERSLKQQDLSACLRLLLPLVVAVLAGIALASRSLIAPIPASGKVVPYLVILLLVVLALARQTVEFLDYVHVQREREAERANAQLWRDTTRHLETFVGIASHELKTPLTSLQGNTEMMARWLNRAQSDQAQAANLIPLLTTMQTLVNRSEGILGQLGRLVNDLLDYSRIRQGRMEHRAEPCDLATIVTQTVEDQRHLVPERTIRLARPEEAPVLVLGDAERLGQVVTNFLTNALKYSPEDCPVEVGVQKDGQQGRVWVRDQGPGIPEDEQAHLWERFYRVPGMEVQSGSGIGLGLGLYISKAITEQHGGQVGVQSAPGEGSTFWFTLPLVVD
jgi:signal transduction histidine kinase